MRRWGITDEQLAAERSARRGAAAAADECVTLAAWLLPLLRAFQTCAEVATVYLPRGRILGPLQPTEMEAALRLMGLPRRTWRRCAELMRVMAAEARKAIAQETVA